MTLADQNVKRAITDLLHIGKKAEENMTIIRREMEDVAKTQIKLLELKNTIPKTKNTLCRIRYCRRKDYEFKDTAIEIFQNKAQEKSAEKRSYQ